MTLNAYQRVQKSAFITQKKTSKDRMLPVSENNNGLTKDNSESLKDAVANKKRNFNQKKFRNDGICARPIKECTRRK